MQYYSDLTKKLYKSQDELLKDEKSHIDAENAKKEIQAKRTERAKEVEDAFKKVQTAQEEANKLLNAFIKDYGKFHTTVKGEHFLNPLLDFMFSNWI